MRILIATGIYPPDVGGPATYAKNVKEALLRQGHEVKVVTYGKERVLPTGLRHLIYFYKVFFAGLNVDHILVLDTWSAAVPTMLACEILRKKYVIRTGGDFLWESYVERTKKPILFKDFYKTCASSLSRKEKVIFRLTKAVLDSADKLIFSTDWQRGIFEAAYLLDPRRNFIVENQYKSAESSTDPENRIFIASSRNIVFKNLSMLERAFSKAQEEINKMGMPNIELDRRTYPHNELIERMKISYAVILVSLGDISPNIIMEALRCGVPCIVTEENGILDRIKDHVLLVDPLNEEDIKNKIAWMADPANREEVARKARAFNFVHTWDEIAREIVDIMAK